MGDEREQRMDTDNKRNWLLHLYISGKTPKVDQTVTLLEKICKEHFKGQGDIKVIDVRQDPLACLEENIIATPTLLKILPEPVRRIIGDLSGKEKLLLGLAIINEE
jgi:circadian clock protein KaiB